MKTKTLNRYIWFVLTILWLAISVACTMENDLRKPLDCYGRIFNSTQIFIRESQLADIDEIDLENPLANHDGFIFSPDGTFESKIEKNGIVYEFSGYYAADNIGSDFTYWFCDVIPSATLEALDVGDGLYNCESNTDEDFFACIELRQKNDVITFINIQ